ncbi:MULTISPECIES: hypothetical protein [Pseudomonas syringae group]|uniref:Uncharacterized protein n=4 Tax=Pseudomonas syringae group TaxID=136849 RepID=A0ABY1UGD6_PSESX|nr:MULTISPECIES: hypothetical protein [Pseudomonas syringae group]KWT12105.1 hypothetical protein AL046_14130 [Pseudomonas syringae pv. avii]POP99297.1 hypothetical protein CXB40_25855 [Pseudomonas syringae pv. avii]RMU56169.1 hypothetical protein ALP29_201838 [Pseudomonas syringae pv. avii]SOS30897.1 hypothetical protein CFBP3846_P400054 [Pseudomonas syringae pv. avii]
MTTYTPGNDREITSEVLLKLRGDALPHLPMACKTCPSAMWQITGKPDRPEAVTVRCYCPVMHTFTWDSRNQEEILDCDHLYQEEDEEDGTGPQLSEEEEEAALPPFLRKQREQQRQQALQADAGPELENPETPEYEPDA